MKTECCNQNCNQGRDCPNRKAMAINLWPWVGVIFMVLALGVVGRMDSDDAQLEVDHYCEMVKAGFWPDFSGTYRDECQQPKSGPR